MIPHCPLERGPRYLSRTVLHPSSKWNKPIHVRNFADDLSAYVFPATCMCAVQNFENSRPLDRGNNNRGKRTQAESAVVQSTLKHQTPTIPGGGGWKRREWGENKKKKKHRPPPPCIYMYVSLLPYACSFRGLRCLRWCNGNRRYHRAEHSIDLDNLISRRIRFPPSILCKVTMIPWRNAVLVSRRIANWSFRALQREQQFHNEKETRL